MVINKKSMSTVIVNGMTFNVPNGKNVSVIGNKVYCDGKLIEDANKLKDKNIYITVNGDIDELSVNCGDVHVKGNVNTVSCDTGDITIAGNVGGDVTTNTGDIKCGNISGSVRTDTGDVSQTISQVFKKIKKKISL